MDLVGSTAYKAGPGSNVDQSGYPTWVGETRRFYTEFPSTLRNRYRQVTLEAKGLSEHMPRLWKTIGDEIVFCCRVQSRQHLSCVLHAFTDALDKYGRVLETRCEQLDVKGTAWLAAFPTPNVTVLVDQNENSEYDLPNEFLEVEADAEPHRFDFLGKNIDCGFRLSKFSSADRLTLSVELALALCEPAVAPADPFRGSFHYQGREVLKGVLNGRPYPVVTVYTERRQTRRDVLELEMGLTTSKIVSSLMLGTFLRQFMLDEKVEAIHVEGFEGAAPPPAYSEFRLQWESNRNEELKREATEEASEKNTDEANGSIPQVVEKVLETIAAPSDENAARDQFSGAR